MGQFDFDVDFQRKVLKLCCTNKKFFDDYGAGLEAELFDTQMMRTLFKLITENIMVYDKEIDLSNLYIILDEYSRSKSLTEEMSLDLREEAKTIFKEYIGSEQFIIDALVKFMRKKKMVNALYKCTEILKNGNESAYEQSLKWIEDAVSYGSGVSSEGLNFNDIYDIPQKYRLKYSPEKLIRTGIPGYDEALCGGMAPGELHVIQGIPKSGKCHGLGTKILMHDGTTKNVEDIKVGDIVMGYNGVPRKVLNTTTGYGKLYKVKQKKGIDYTINEDHILSLKANGRPFVKGDLYNVPLREYLTLTEGRKHHLKGHKSKLDFEAKDVELDPYFLGVWLGDGSSTDSIIYTPDQEILEYLDSLASKLSMSTRHFERKGCTKCTLKADPLDNTPNQILFALQGYNLIQNKHIPKEYLFNSEEVRKAILAGLLDTDGHNSNHSGIVEITTKFDQLSKDILFLARSLGFRANCVVKKATIKSLDFEGSYYRINISGDFSKLGMLIDRKIPEYKGHRDPLNTGIEVEYIGEGDYAGFAVDGDNLYLLEDFTVTHNSSFSCALGSNMLLDGKVVFHVTLEIKELDVMLKYAARLSRLSYSELTQIDQQEYERRMERFKSLQPNLFIQYWTNETANCLNIRSWISRIRSKKGISPDIIIVDYDDCLIPVGGSTTDMYENSGKIYSDLIGLADYFSCPILTFAQPKREAWELPDKDQIVQSYHLAHSAKKAHKCFSLSSLNFRSDSDTGFLYADLFRRGKSNYKVPLVRNLEKCDFYQPDTYD